MQKKVCYQSDPSPARQGGEVDSIGCFFVQYPAHHQQQVQTNATNTASQVSAIKAVKVPVESSYFRNRLGWGREARRGESISLLKRRELGESNGDPQRCLSDANGRIETGHSSRYGVCHARMVTRWRILLLCSRKSKHVMAEFRKESKRM